MRHELVRHLTRQGGINAAADVDLGQLAAFAAEVLAQLGTLLRQRSGLRIGLRMY